MNKLNQKFLYSLLIILTFFGCRNKDLKPSEDQCLLMRTVDEKGKEINSFKYDENARLLEFSTDFNQLNFKMFHFKDSTKIRSGLIGNQTMYYNPDKTLRSIRQSFGDLNMLYKDGLIKKIVIKNVNFQVIFVPPNSSIIIDFVYENGNVIEVFSTYLGGEKRSIFKGLKFDQSKQVYPKDMVDYMTVATINGIYTNNLETPDFSFLGKNNMSSYQVLNGAQGSTFDSINCTFQTSENNKILTQEWVNEKISSFVRKSIFEFSCN